LVEFKKENKEKLKEYERLQKAIKPTEKKATIEDVLKRLDDIEAKVGKQVVYTETPS
jgi:tetrahydromethanopterin S-methyltransferase subunit G